MTTIEDVIGPGLIDVDLKATDTAGAIRELATLMEAEGRVSDREAFVDAVLAREEETGGTGMERGSGCAASPPATPPPPPPSSASTSTSSP